MTAEMPTWIQVVGVLLPVFGPLFIITFLLWLGSGGSLKQPRSDDDWVGDPELAQRAARRVSR